MFGEGNKILLGEGLLRGNFTSGGRRENFWLVRGTHLHPPSRENPVIAFVLLSRYSVVTILFEQIGDKNSQM